jgi:hypothetical protein
MGKLKAGAAVVDMSPEVGVSIAGYFNDRKAVDIHDPINARALVLENEDQSLAIVVADLIAVTEEETKPAKERAAELTGIPVENIMMSATHTHYGPSTVGIFNSPKEEAYCEMVARKMGDAVRLAQNRARAAVMGRASGSVPEEVFNRDWLMKDGTVMMNPGFLNPDRVKCMGPTDPQVGVLAVRTAEGEPIAALANYALHYVGGPYHDEISADYFGYFARALERMLGGGVAIMANGACGNINNCNWDREAPAYPHPYYQAERVGTVVAAEAYRRWNQIWDWSEDVALGVANGYPMFRRREPDAAMNEEMETLLSGPADPDNYKWMYARERQALMQTPLDQLAQIQAMRIGNLGLVALPGEVFVEIGLAIKEQSPFPQTMVAELANQSFGYIPTDKALAEGSYETWLARSSQASAGTEGQWVKAAVELLGGLSKV